MDQNKSKNQRYSRRKARTKAKIFGTAIKPRLAVYRSLKHISCQLIDDVNEKTIISASDKEIKGIKTDKAKEVGKLIAIKALENKIEAVIFDRAGNKYHGRVKALAESAREAGLKF